MIEDVGSFIEKFAVEFWSAVGRSEYFWACPHVMSGAGLERSIRLVEEEDLPVLCMHHPAAGLMCRECLVTEHCVRAHAVETCAICGDPATSFGFSFPWDITETNALPIRTADLMTNYFGRALPFGIPTCDLHGNEMREKLALLTS